MNRKLTFCLLLVLAVALAGCSLSGCSYFTGSSGKHMGEDIAPIISQPTTAPPSVEQTGQALPDKPFDLARARWAEYKLIVYSNGQPSTSTVRLEYGTSTANGMKTQSIKRTITSNDAPAVNLFGDGKVYGLHVYNSRNSMTTSTMVPFDQLKADDPVLYAGDIPASPAGSESVTVPRGTFDCKKYFASFKGADSTYWGAPGIPVPVKVYTAGDGATLELVDWG